jgi:uncharacterized membrane protein YgdD (TMEM256/DUF423 family)
MNKKIAIAGATLAGLSVVFGAFGAHALKALLTEAQQLSYETAVRYQMFHALALLVLGFADKQLGGSYKAARWMLTGTILFSFSIYLLSLQDILGMSLSFLGPVTPLGGLCLIISWIIIIYQILQHKS